MNGISKNICKKVCKKVRAHCVYYSILKFYKSCPKLECYRAFINGENNKPSVFISKKGKFVRKTAVHRTAKQY